MANESQMGHELAGAAKEGIGSVAEKAEAADDIVRRAEDYIADAERRLDAFIDATERLFERGTEYTGKAKAWVDDHREYRDKAQALMQKAADFRRRVRERAGSFGQQTGESGEEIAAGPRRRFSDYAARGREGVKNGARSASSFVRENPIDSLLVGAAVGVLVGTAYKHLTAQAAAGFAADEGALHGNL